MTAYPWPTAETPAERIQRALLLGWIYPDEESTQLLAFLRQQILHEAAEKIRANADATCPNDDPRWNGMQAAADLLEQP